MQVDQDTIDLLDAFRRRRNIIDYDRAGTVSQQEANEMYTLASELRNNVESWLRTNHPHLSNK
jgi:hypothetical protein